MAAELQRRLNDEQRAEFWKEARHADRVHLKRRMRHARRAHRERMVRRMRRERLHRRDRRPLIHRAVWMAARALAEILTPEQQEIVRLYHRLVRAWQAVRRKD